MTENRRITRDEILQDAFYGLPKLFDWNPKYRNGLSNDAKVLYSKIRDRFTLSLNTNEVFAGAGQMEPYIDQDENVYCIFERLEISFALNKSPKTAEKVLNELVEMKLVEMEKVPGKASRLYLCRPDNDGYDIHTYRAEYEYFKHTEMAKKKNREVEHDLAYFMKKSLQKRALKGGGKNYSPVDNGQKEEGGKNYSPVDNPPKEGGGEQELPPQGSKNSPPEVAKVTPQGVQNLPPSKNDSSKTDFSKTDIANITSSSDDVLEAEKEKEEEEEKMETPRITFENNYENLIVYLEMEKDLSNQRALAVIKKKLMEAKVAEVKRSDMIKALIHHEVNVQAYQQKGEPIQYAPAFFANNLIDRIRERELNQEAMRPKEAAATGNKTGVFYNWLESGE